MKLKFDGIVRLEEGDRYWGHYWALNDCVFYHGYGFWLFAIGWHWEQ